MSLCSPKKTLERSPSLIIVLNPLSKQMLNMLLNNFLNASQISFCPRAMLLGSTWRWKQPFLRFRKAGGLIFMCQWLYVDSYQLRNWHRVRSSFSHSSPLLLYIEDVAEPPVRELAACLVAVIRAGKSQLSCKLLTLDCMWRDLALPNCLECLLRWC